MRCALLKTTVLLVTVGCKLPAPDASGGADVQKVTFTAHAVSEDARMLAVELRSDVRLRGEVVVVWGRTETSGRLAGDTARIPLPDVDAILPTPPPRAVPPLGQARVFLRGRAQGGEATLQFGGDPAAEAVRAALVGAHARAVEAHRAGWLEANKAEVEALQAEAKHLASGIRMLQGPAPRGRTDEELEELTGLEQACAQFAPALPKFTRRLEKAESVLLGAVPGLPVALTDVPAAKTAARDVRWGCGFVQQSLDRVARHRAMAAEATVTRTRLVAKRSTRRAIAAIDLVEATLRGAAGDEVLLQYEEALLDWGDAETMVLRLRSGSPAAAERARERATAAEERVDGLNASIGLSLSGRSGQIGDAVEGAAKLLKLLSEDDREAVLGLFDPEITPAGRILQQLVRDAVR